MLGQDLLACQHLEGFAEQRDALRTGTLLGVAHELHIARLLAESDHDVRFVTRPVSWAQTSTYPWTALWRPKPRPRTTTPHIPTPR
jgi:hypothetical protein